VIEVDRAVDGDGTADLGGHRLKVGPELARRRVTLRLDGHLVHVISGGVLAKTLPSPIPAGTLRSARIAAAPLPPPAPGPVSVQRKVPPRRRHHGHPPAAARRCRLLRQQPFAS